MNCGITYFVPILYATVLWIYEFEFITKEDSLQKSIFTIALRTGPKFLKTGGINP